MAPFATARAAIVAASLVFSIVVQTAAAQPLDGPNVARQSDLAAGAAVDSLFESLEASQRKTDAAAKALGGQPSRASQRPQWTARLARNPKQGDGNPPYVLIDRYGGIQRYVETVPQIDLESHIGQQVSVRRDTGHTLLASQLELPRSARGATVAASIGVKSDGNIKLATMNEQLPSLEPTPAEGSSAEPLPLQPEAIEGEVIDGGIIEGEVPLEGPVFDESGRPITMHGGTDPLYLDDGLHFDGCDNCGSKLCKVQGGCGFGSRPIFYARGEYLLWQFKGMDIPALVVRGDVNDAGTPADPTDDFFDNAVVVHGNESILDDARSGGRITLGYWLDDYGHWAIEGDYFAFGQIESRFVDGGPGTVVGRPFIDATTGRNAVELVEFPGVISGTVTIDANSTFQSAGIRLRRNLCCVAGCQTDCGDAITCGSCVGGGAGAVGEAPCLKFFQKGTRHVDVLYGFRWAQLEDGLPKFEDLVDANDNTFLVDDDFASSNEFVGGEIGFLWDWQRERWSLEFLSKLAIGSTRQRVFINGSTIRDNPTDADPPESKVGGLLAQSTNIGEYERDEFSVMPELGLTAGYMVTDRLKLTLGYNFLYWSRVARPGDQIDLEVDPGHLEFPPNPDPEVGRPQFVFRDADLWAHGLNAGLEYQW